MKLLMLCREPRLYSCQRLKQAAEALGYEMDILDPNRFSLQLTQGEFQLFYQYAEPYEKSCTDVVKVSDYAGVLGRFGISSTSMGCHVLRHFELKGVPVLNSSHAFALARDKWQSLQQLAAQAVPVPTTVINGDLAGSMAGMQVVGTPLVIKTLSGSQGVGVMLSETPSSAKSLVDTLNAAKIPTLLQTFVKEAQGQDIRAFVIGDEVVAAMSRQGSNGEFRANIHQGGTATPIRLSAAENALAVKATKVLGLDVAGVDLIRSANGLMVLEVNASAGLEMIEKVSQQPIAEKMVAYLINKIA